MSGWTVTLITTALILLSAFFVVIEFALMGARRHRLESDAASRVSARAALRGMNELTLMLAAAQLGITVCTFALGAVTKPAIDYLLEPILMGLGLPVWLSGGLAFASSLVFVTFLHLVVGEMAPKSWAIAHPERAAALIGVPARILVWPLRPFLSWVNAVANRLVAKVGITPVDRAVVGGRDAAAIRQLVEHSAQSGALEEGLQAHISEVIHLQDLTVGDIATFSRTLTAVAASAMVADVQHAARMSGHLRILLQEADGTHAQVVHVRDTLTSDMHTPARGFARPLLCVPEAVSVYDLLRRMREGRVQLALVAGETSGVGVVTMKDVIRRILPAEPVR